MLLELKGITKNFGENRVLRGIDLAVPSGSAFGLLGRNGAGKTTMIRIVMEVFRPDSGQVLLDGKPFRRGMLRVGYLPEERGMYPKKTVIEQLIYFGELAGLKADAAKRNALSLLERLGMGETAGKKLMTLSKGNQQKIQFVATLIAEPELVVLDEPFSGLDPVNAMLLEDLVRELVERGSLVFFSSHQMNYIEEFCHEIAILNGGNIVREGKIAEMKRGHDRSRIIVRSPQVEQLAVFVRSQTGIARDVNLEDEAVTIQLTTQEKKPELLSMLAARGFDVDSFAVWEPSLQDIFVDATTSRHGTLEGGLA
ncbi:MAG: ATP-binding cassette domain-containing protein [Oscillospiraceae bacterium]|nr:ATP-binding cassette domain-containing protein [Oscillospiraceae bacterium]